MKNFLRIFGVITLVMVIGFFMAACDAFGGNGDDDDDEVITGKLTIVGFDFDEDNKYIMADAWLEGVYYFAAAEYEDGDITLGEIKNKVVALSVWENKGAEPELYSGSAEITFNVYLFSSETALDDGDDADETMKVTIKFKRGIGIGEVEEIPAP